MKGVIGVGIFDMFFENSWVKFLDVVKLLFKFNLVNSVLLWVMYVGVVNGVGVIGI